MLKKQAWRKVLKSERGLSLIEILIGLTLIGLFLSIVGTQVMKNFGEGKRMTTEIQIKSIETALDDFKRKCGFYPPTEWGLEALASKPSATGGKECPNWSSSLAKVPKDAWGNDFVYSNASGKLLIKSLGADNKEGGEDEDKDVNNEDL